MAHLSSGLQDYGLIYMANLQLLVLSDSAYFNVLTIDTDFYSNLQAVASKDD